MIRKRIKQGKKGIYFFSALKNSNPALGFNTTNMLLQIGEACAQGNQERALGCFAELEQFHARTIMREFPTDIRMQTILIEKNQSLFQEYRERIISWFDGKSETVPTEKQDYILANSRGDFSLL